MQENIENNPQTEVVDRQNAISELNESLYIMFENMSDKIQPEEFSSPALGRYRSWTFEKKFTRNGKDRALLITKFEGLSKHKPDLIPYAISTWKKDKASSGGGYKQLEDITIDGKSIKTKTSEGISDVNTEKIIRLTNNVKVLDIIPNEANWEEFKNKGWEAFKNYQPGAEINGKPLNDFIADLKKTFGEKNVLSGPPYDFENEKITGLDHEQRKSNEISKENLGCIYIKRDKNKESETE